MSASAAAIVLAVFSFTIGLHAFLPIVGMPVNTAVIITLGVLVGFLSAKFGFGGGFILAPFLMFLGIPPAVAVATQSAQIVASSVPGVLTHWRKGNVDFNVSSLLLVGGLADDYGHILAQR